jgi:hypothetical protein
MGQRSAATSLCMTSRRCCAKGRGLAPRRVPELPKTRRSARRMPLTATSAVRIQRKGHGGHRVPRRVADAAQSSRRWSSREPGRESRFIA